MHLPDLPLYAVQRSASDCRLVRAPSDDPFLPAVLIIDVVEITHERAYARSARTASESRRVDQILSVVSVERA